MYRAATDSEKAEWKLYYPTYVGGRAEFIKIMLEDAKINYEQVDGPENIAGVLHTSEGWPCFALPVLEKNSGARLCGTAGICVFLGRQYDRHPPNDLLLEAKAEQAFGYCIDMFDCCGRVTMGGSDVIEMEELKSSKIPKFLTHFNKILGANQHAGGYVVGDTPTFADFGIFTALRCAEEYYDKEEFNEMVRKYNKLPQFKEKMAGRPQIATYLKSDRNKGIMPTQHSATP